MPRHRSLTLRKFLDAIPPSLIEEYFQQEFKSEVRLNAYDYEAIDELLSGTAEEDLKGKIKEDFTHINDICEKHMNVLVRAMDRYRIESSGTENTQELAMRMFLHHSEVFDYAYDYYCLSYSTSKMSQYNITANRCEISPKKIKRFEERVENYYHKAEKGQLCRVRHYDEEDQSVIVVLHGSYLRPWNVWKGQRLETVYFRRASEDILQFDKKKSILSVKAPYQKDRENYIKAFTETILEDETQANRPDRDATYTLEPLQNNTFSFAGNEQIISIILVEVKLRLKGITFPEVTIKSTDVLRTLDTFGNLKLDSGELVHAKFRFQLEVDGKTRGVTFEITPPNVTDLPRKRYAEVIGEYLKENGVKLV